MKIVGLVTGLVLLVAAGAYADGPVRLDLSPTALINVGSGHGGQFMGGGLTADLFFNQAFALRTTVGFSKNRYYPHELDYNDAPYGFWLSIAPYGEVSLMGTVRPYAAVIGSFSSGLSGNVGQSTGNELAPVNRIQPAQERGGAWSVGGTLGTKFTLAGPVGIFGEITHYFYTSSSQSQTTFAGGLPDATFNYDWDRSPTYLSLGLTYSIPLKKSAE